MAHKSNKLLLDLLYEQNLYELRFVRLLLKALLRGNSFTDLHMFV